MGTTNKVQCGLGFGTSASKKTKQNKKKKPLSKYLSGQCPSRSHILFR